MSSALFVLVSYFLLMQNADTRTLIELAILGDNFYEFKL